jgi:hypothetical protein
MSGLAHYLHQNIIAKQHLSILRKMHLPLRTTHIMTAFSDGEPSPLPNLVDLILHLRNNLQLCPRCTIDPSDSVDAAAASRHQYSANALEFSTASRWKQSSAHLSSL